MGARNFQIFITLQSLGIILLSATALPSFARGNDFSLTDGAGEQIQVKHSLFGRNKTVMKDRFGDGFAQQNGLLGNKTSEVSLLGNRVLHKKGLLGNTETDASTIFGATMVSKKGIFGRRTTAVDLSGTNQIVRSFLGRPTQFAGMPAGGPMQNMSSMQGGPVAPASSGQNLPPSYNAPSAPMPRGEDVNVNGDPLVH